MNLLFNPALVDPTLIYKELSKLPKEKEFFISLIKEKLFISTIFEKKQPTVAEFTAYLTSKIKENPQNPMWLQCKKLLEELIAKQPGDSALQSTLDALNKALPEADHTTPLHQPSVTIGPS